MVIKCTTLGSTREPGVPIRKHTLAVSSYKVLHQAIQAGSIVTKCLRKYLELSILVSQLNDVYYSGVIGLIHRTRGVQDIVK